MININSKIESVVRNIITQQTIFNPYDLNNIWLTFDEYNEFLALNGNTNIAVIPNGWENAALKIEIHPDFEAVRSYLKLNDSEIKLYLEDDNSTLEGYDY